jgi:MFS superfamily sulfate permease-like transporter
VFVTNHPGLNRLQGRLSRMPRWGWLALMIGVAIPLIAIVMLAFVSGIVVFIAVGVVVVIVNFVRRLFHRRVDDGRRNVQIMVHSARVIDP